jgi:quinol monooxygenase YgiN
LNFYVYYKVAPGQLAKLRPQVQDLFRQIREKFGVQGRWMHRRDDASTYMEVYEGVKDEAAFEALLEREGAKLGMPRKVERFISAETPA